MTEHVYPLLGRGVYRAPCLGPNGETILLAVDYRGCLIPEGRVLIGEADVAATKAALWNLLDTVDAEHARRRSRSRGRPPVRYSSGGVSGS